MVRLTLSAAAPDLIKTCNIWWKAFGGIPDSLVRTVTGVLDEKCTIAVQASILK